MNSKKKRVTAGEVDKLGKEQGTTNEWTMNDDTNTQALSTLSLLQVKEERQQQKKERSRGEDRREGGNQTESKEFQQRIRNFVLFSASFFLLLLSIFLL